MSRILVLGAEAQAATSLALAYPEHDVVFVSDQDILDGSDLPNVEMLLSTPSEIAHLPKADPVVALSARWLSSEIDYSLGGTFERLRRKMPETILPVCRSPAPDGGWIIKGDRWHKPDAPVSGTAELIANHADPHGCGIVFQPFHDVKATIMVVGRRDGSHATRLGVIHVLEERFFRIDVLQAGETIDAPEIVAASMDVLDALDHVGFFTLNWLRLEGGLRLSSFRPAPRAVFQMFRRGGVDLLDTSSGRSVVAAGQRMIADPTYVSFERLKA